MRIKFYLLAILLLLSIPLAGCVQHGPPAPVTTKTPLITTPSTTTPVTTLKTPPNITYVLTPTTAPTKIPTPPPTPITFEFGKKYRAKVVQVVDGDTIDVLINGKTYRIRLLGVDCPETTAEKNRPYEYDSITDLEYLAEWGRNE